MDKLIERRVSSVSLDRTVSTGELLSSFDVHHVGTEALLFQNGYLTITGKKSWAASCCTGWAIRIGKYGRV